VVPEDPAIRQFLVGRLALQGLQGLQDHSIQEIHYYLADPVVQIDQQDQVVQLVLEVHHFQVVLVIRMVLVVLVGPMDQMVHLVRMDLWVQQDLIVRKDQDFH